MMDDDKRTSPPPSLSLARFRTLVAAYGGESERWPREERDAAEALAAHSPEARAIRDPAARLDRILAGLAPPAPSAALKERLRALGPLPRADADGVRPVSPWLPAFASLRALWRPVAFGGAVAALAAAAVVLAVWPRPAEAPRTTMTVAASSEAPEPALLDGLALIDASENGFEAFSADGLDLQDLAGPAGGALAPAGADLAELAIE